MNYAESDKRTPSLNPSNVVKTEYVDLEERFKLNAVQTFGASVGEIHRLVILAHSIDWVAIGLDLEHAVPSMLQDAANEGRGELLIKLTSASILRLPEFQENTPESILTIDLIYQSIKWQLSFNPDEMLRGAAIDYEDFHTCVYENKALLTLFLLSFIPISTWT